MTQIHYAECDAAHNGQFVLDVPAGGHWLLVVIQTPALFWVDGDLKEYPPHSAVLYRPGQKVYYKACSDSFVNDWIRFESSEKFITETPLPHGVPFALDDPDYCRKLFELLIIEHRFQRDYKQTSIHYLLRTLFNKLAESCFHGSVSPHYYELLRLRIAIQNRPGEPWTVSKMADMLQVSSGYLQTIYKKTFGISCMEDVIDNRIGLAKEYLTNGSLSVSEVASRCGYPNVEHFCRQFKRQTGCTPGQYHRQAARR